MVRQMLCQGDVYIDHNIAPCVLTPQKNVLKQVQWIGAIS